ncbi:hypothetical protein [Streptomyces sp. UH6]|uniref:hypothetical protein n=1 Tax=Streptomyces sp. UH6 TaxID=2748379 RepID=UPI0015D4D983|nr:hypothetical protein [Streptomyces sp. UH6]NYV75344.1 hypothetical protein [Streptomyces sp. UH6]
MPPTTPASAASVRDLARKMRASVDEFTLVDADGHIPDPPPYADLLHHVRTTHQHLVDVVELATAEATAGCPDRPPGTRERLVLAASDALAASYLFGHTLRDVLASADIKPHESAIVLAHAGARAELRRGAEALDETAVLLEQHQATQGPSPSMRLPDQPPKRPGPTR